ncbi:MAG: hypothetical protein IJR25_03700 [Bacteroidales bacterium]|nr:hypothetical protein [Bacteroidales bacterium]
MKHLVRFCRLIVGLVFLFSGFVKLLSPVGTSLIIKEYFVALHIGFMTPVALVAGIVLASLEFLTAVALLLRLRFRLAAWIALILVSIFTLLTLYLAIFNPISDCGCFGEAIHLTNWQTFFKNLILLPCAIVIFIWRKAVSEFSKPALELVFLGLFALLDAAVLLQTFLWAPIAEFTDYRVGYEIRQTPAQSSGEIYETVFVYEKDGVQQTFPLDNLPDSAWMFVEAVTTKKAPGSEPSGVDFFVEAPDGSDISGDLLLRRDLLLMTIYHPDRFFKRHTTAQIVQIKEAAEKQGLDFVLVASDNIGGLIDDCPVNRADLKLLMTMNRSNGGVMLLDEGTIMRKWTFIRAVKGDADFCGGKDPELTLLMSLNRQRMSLEIALVAFILICLAKFIVFYKKKE